MAEVPAYGTHEYYHGAEQPTGSGAAAEATASFTAMAEEWLASADFDEAVRPLAARGATAALPFPAAICCQRRGLGVTFLCV
jgi:hypothetical protein